jgi:hypothetical protein
MTTPTIKQEILTHVRKIFLGDDNHSPLFMNSQKAPGRLKLNQLAKRAVYRRRKEKLARRNE